MLTGARFASMIVSWNDTAAGLSGLAFGLSARQRRGTKEMLNKA